MELKFRAWHKEHKKYWGVMSILFDTQELELYEWGNVRFNEVIIEQYTGETDIDGKELYVGDIAIEFGEIILIEDVRDVSKCNIMPQFEIIGNIHENKELLNG